MKRLLIATSNMGKFREFSEMLTGRFDELFSLADFPGLILPPETGCTFEENSIIKARHASIESGIPSLADDSGLEVECLGGLPGVHSARFAGESASDKDNNEKLLAALAQVRSDRRDARFRCSIAFCLGNGSCVTFSGELNGRIIEQPKGSNGFGYDPLFLVAEYDSTLAELDIGIKNSISHRSKALKKFTEYLATCRELI